MNRSLLIIVVAALLVSVLVAVIVQSKIQPQETAQVEAAPQVEILVANKDISIGETISRSHVRWQVWPEAALFESAIQKDQVETDAFLEKVVKRSFAKDEPISIHAFVDMAEGGFLAAALGDGMRAFAVEVSADSAVAGFITPGDHVDVILTYRVQVRSDVEEETQELVVRDTSETILRNVRVLAVDQDTSSGEDREVKVGKTVTLEVGKSGAETLALASEMGELRLALRRLGDKDVGASDEKDALTTDVGIGRTLREVIQTRNAAVQSTNTIRIYGGGQARDIQVRLPGENGRASVPANTNRLEQEPLP